MTVDPVLPFPRGSEWTMEDDEWILVMTTLLPAPEAIIQLVKCKCAKQRSSNNRCQCRKVGLPCTDLCSCYDADECENLKAKMMVIIVMSRWRNS